MKIIRITSGNQPLSPLEHRLREAMSVPTVEVAPAWLSAFTALKVAKRIDREGAGTVEATIVEDILTAISAKRIARKKDVRIVVNLRPNSPTPLTLPEEIRTNADLWIFPSERMRNEFRKLGELRKTAVIEPACFKETKIKPTANEGQSHTVVILTQRPDTTHIIRIIDATDAYPTPITLHFLGKSEAKHIMPAVQHAQRIAHPERILWEGDQYDLAEQLGRAAAVIKAGIDMTEDECAISAAERPVIDITELERMPSKEARREFAETHNPHFHVEQFSKILNAI